MTKPIVTFAVMLVAFAGVAHAGEAKAAPLEAEKHTPEFIQSDGALKLTFGEERIVLPRGLQPSMLVTTSGSVILPSSRMTYFSAMSARVSRDGAPSWTDIPFDLPGHDLYGSTDDGGRPQAAQRLHRRILELPSGGDGTRASFE